MRKNNFVPVVVSVLAMCAVSALLLLGLSAAVFYMELPANIIQIGITVIYLLSGLMGGLLVGKMQREKKFLWGIITGIVFFLLLLVLSLLYNSGHIVDVVHMLSVLVLTVLSSMIGGMIS